MPGLLGQAGAMLGKPSDMAHIRYEWLAWDGAGRQKAGLQWSR